MANTNDMSKQLMAAFQGVVLDERGSDCGTSGYLEVTMDPHMEKALRYRYVTFKGKLVKLDKKGMALVKGERVKLRSPMFCRSKKICNKCYGELPYLLGIQNVGLTYNTVGEVLKNQSMKAFHDSSVRIGNIDLDQVISPA